MGGSSFPISPVISKGSGARQGPSASVESGAEAPEPLAVLAFPTVPAISARVAETFYSIQGEGATAGQPAIFVRLQGCSVGCGWCDTKYSWDPAGGREATLPALLDEVAALPCRRVVVTGGEPLESALFAPLVGELERRGYAIEVETSGTLVPPADAPPSIQWNVSVKLAGSGVAEERRINPSAIRAFLPRAAWGEA